MIYIDHTGKSPFIEWLESLKDKSIRFRIKERLDRVCLGNFGDYKKLSGNISELRFNFSSGHRIYFAEDGNEIILLLCGGDKSTQKKDIKKAKEYWQDYLLR